MFNSKLTESTLLKILLFLHKLKINLSYKHCNLSLFCYKIYRQSKRVWLNLDTFLTYKEYILF